MKYVRSAGLAFFLVSSRGDFYNLEDDVCCVVFQIFVREDWTS